MSKRRKQEGKKTMTGRTALVYPGQVIRHKLFNYRGVVYDVDPVFMLEDEWYDAMTGNRPPKDAPWYRVLVHDSDEETYVAEANLEPDATGEPVNHPAIQELFVGYREGRYVPRDYLN